MPYSKRKSVMIMELVKMYGEKDVAAGLEISIDSVKRAIRYAKRVMVTTC